MTRRAIGGIVRDVERYRRAFKIALHISKPRARLAMRTAHGEAVFQPPVSSIAFSVCKGEADQGK